MTIRNDSKLKTQLRSQFAESLAIMDAAQLSDSPLIEGLLDGLVSSTQEEIREKVRLLILFHNSEDLLREHVTTTFQRRLRGIMNDVSLCLKIDPDL
jgi:hypothetical protein